MKAFFIFAFSILLVCFCPAACADPKNCPYDPHLSIMYNYLADNQRELYDSMYNAIREGKSFVIAPKRMSIEDVKLNHKINSSVRENNR